MVEAGLTGIAIGIGALAWRSMRWTLCGRLAIGVLTIGVASISAFALTLLLAGPIAALTVPTGATLVGFAAALASGGEDSDPAPDVEPPWWPSFERDLRRYERTRLPARRR
jgi:hypothetical protein